MMVETTMIILGRKRRKEDKANSSVTPFPIKYWPIGQQEWRYQLNKPRATAGKRRWNGDTTSEHTRRSGEDRDMLHNTTKPKTKSAHLNCKRETQKHFRCLYKSAYMPEKPKDYQQQSKLQAAFKDTKEDEGTSAYLWPAKTFNLLTRQSNESQTTRAALSGFTARWRQRLFFN